MRSDIGTARSLDCLERHSVPALRFRGVDQELLGVRCPGGSGHSDRRIVYATDHEHGMEVVDRALIEFSRGADYLIYDATYQPAEYEELRRGWGHSTWYAGVQTALAAKVGTLVLFHHHPDHTDEQLDRVLEVARREFPSTVLAREKLELPF